MIVANDVEVKPTIFPDGTSQVWNLDKSVFSPHVNIDWCFDSESEIFHIVQLVDLIRAEVLGANIQLTIEYLPYARQDKKISNKTTFALHSFSKIINMLGFSKVQVLDVHSNQSMMIHNLVNINPFTEIVLSAAKFEKDKLYLFYPDEGAADRFCQEKPFPIKSGHGIKVRDENGDITSFSMSKNSSDVNGCDVLIIDDICDGGRTFIEAARVLYGLGANSVNLYVTHGLFTKGVKVLRDAGIKRIFTVKGEVG